MTIQEQKAQFEFINKTDKEFKDVSHTLFREYLFKNGTKLRIENPMRIHVNDHSHRVTDLNGVSYYIFLEEKMPVAYIMWQSEQGKPHFVF
jgi:hypothetical protein